MIEMGVRSISEKKSLLKISERSFKPSQTMHAKCDEELTTYKSVVNTLRERLEVYKEE